MPNDLYNALGVEKSSSKDEIRKAFKNKVKKVHPDMPNGDSKKFALVKRAHDILMDDKRREKYDATGNDSEIQPDNSIPNAVNIITMIFNMVLSECAQSGTSPLEVDIISKIKSKLRQNMSEGEKQIRINKNIIEYDEKLRGRFIKKKKNDELNIFDNLISFRLRTVKDNIAQAENSIKVCEEALKLSEEYSFTCDKRDNRPTATSIFVNFGGF